MTIVGVEVVADPDANLGGHALVRLTGAKSLPEFPRLRIESIDEQAAGRLLQGWPSGDVPVTWRLTPEGFELCIGPEIVDAPALLPGMPVRLSVPGTPIDVEMRWPDLPPSRIAWPHPARRVAESAVATPVNSAKPYTSLRDAVAKVKAGPFIPPTRAATLPRASAAASRGKDRGMLAPTLPHAATGSGTSPAAAPRQFSERRREAGLEPLSRLAWKPAPTVAAGLDALEPEDMPSWARQLGGAIGGEPLPRSVRPLQAPVLDIRGPRPPVRERPVATDRPNRTTPFVCGFLAGACVAAAMMLGLAQSVLPRSIAGAAEVWSRGTLASAMNPLASVASGNSSSVHDLPRAYVVRGVRGDTANGR